MIIYSLRVDSFRNYHKEEVAFSPSLNFFVGENAAGKTNLLEAVGYFVMYRSFRNVGDASLIRHGENHFYLMMKARNAKNEDATYEVGVEKKQEGIKKKIKKEGKQVKKISELFSEVMGVFFAPGDIEIVDSLTKRRNFFDAFFSLLDSEYLQLLTEYQRVLRQRNELLKRIAEKKSSYSELDFWDRIIVETSCGIITKRSSYLKEFEVFFRNRIHEISDSKDEVFLNLNQMDPEKFQDVFYRNRFKDLQAGTTTAGIHRDRFLFLDSYGSDISLSFSQGQKRSVVLALKLAQNDLIQKQFRISPVLFIDDVFRELDGKRRRYFLHAIRGIGQVFFTTPAIEEDLLLLKQMKGQDSKVFEIQSGRIVNGF